jgi:segregation and condensation protein A
VEMLVEYRRIKRAASVLADMKSKADCYWQRPPMFANLLERTIAPCMVQDLLEALASMAAPTGRQAAFIEPQAFSVQDKMADILQRLQQRPQGILLNDFFASGQVGEKVAAFLGVLELLKLGLVAISQAQRFAPIYIFAKQGEEAHVSG